MRTQYWLSGLVALVMSCTTVNLALAAEEGITVVSWGGFYGQAQVTAMHQPFTDKTGIPVHSVEYSGGLAEIKAQQETGNVTWDVVDLWASDAILGCNEGLLEKIDPSILPPAPDGTPAVEDFIPGTLLDCGVGLMVGSTLLAYNKDQFKGGPVPTSVVDFFDVKKFPQMRSLQNTPQNNLEWALLADGVSRQKLYELLATKAGVDRAFRKLDTLKPYVNVWWTAGSQPPSLLASGDVAMTSSFNSRITNAVINNDQPFVIIWDRAMWSFDVKAITKGTPRLDKAMEYLKFATSTEPLAQQAGITINGPSRASSVGPMAKYVKPGIDVTPFNPIAPQNFKTQVQFDIGFWVDHGDELNEIFAAWLAK